MSVNVGNGSRSPIQLPEQPPATPPDTASTDAAATSQTQDAGPAGEAAATYGSTALEHGAEFLDPEVSNRSGGYTTEADSETGGVSFEDLQSVSSGAISTSSGSTRSETRSSPSPTVSSPVSNETSSATQSSSSPSTTSTSASSGAERQQVQNQLTELAAMAAEVSKAMQAQRSELSQMRKAMAQKWEEMADTAAKLIQAQEHLEDSRGKGKGDERALARANIEKYTKDMERLTTELEEMSAQIESTVAKLESTNTDLKKLQESAKELGPEAEEHGREAYHNKITNDIEKMLEDSEAMQEETQKLIEANTFDSELLMAAITGGRGVNVQGDNLQIFGRGNTSLDDMGSNAMSFLLLLDRMEPLLDTGLDKDTSPFINEFMDDVRRNS
ncbi:MAG: hypothetical protein AAF219_01910 [Myxococcota bacterium]